MKKSVLAMSLMLSTMTAYAADDSVSDRTDRGSSAEQVKPNNTEVNKRDRDERALTPMDQSNSKADIDITQAIRRGIMNQDLSTNAKNIKVITQAGQVTLRGPVNSQAELQKIVQLAKAVPGIKTLNNQLEVK